MDADFAIVGSGFGGSVAALRLAEKGHRVVVLEQGRRFGRAELAGAQQSMRRFLWNPALGMNGFFAQRFLKHVAVVHGVAVGGGSIVYAGVLLRPRTGFFLDAAWRSLGVDWERELAPHYVKAEMMLGAREVPSLGAQDAALRRAAEALGAGASFGPTTNGIFFGAPGVEVADPYFGGEGPRRSGCIQCGACMSGCPYDAKNSLDRNYLHLAERRGARILAGHRVEHVAPRDGGYRVVLAEAEPIDAKRVVLAGGVLGTLEVLFRSRDEARSLPHVSARLGERVRTNNEALVAALAPRGTDFVVGPAISSHFFMGRTHVTQNRFGPASNTNRFLMGPLVDATATPGRRALRVLGAAVRSPGALLGAWFGPDFHRRNTVLTVMEEGDGELALRWERGALHSALPSERAPAPSHLPIANEIARAFADAVDGVAMNSLLETLGGKAVTAHPLGGCPMGRSAEEGVIDVRHEVFGHPGLFVVDGSAVQANVGVNPSLTIAAMAERWADGVEAR